MRRAMLRKKSAHALQSKDSDQDAAKISAGDHQVNSLGAFALLVRFNLKAEPLAFVQRFQPRTFDCGDVHEDVTPAVVRLHETIASFTVEKLHNARLRHREAPPHALHRRPPPCGSTARPDSCSQKRQPHGFGSAGPPYWKAEYPASGI